MEFYNGMRLTVLGHGPCFLRASGHGWQVVDSAGQVQYEPVSSAQLQVLLDRGFYKKEDAAAAAAEQELREEFSGLLFEDEPPRERRHVEDRRGSARRTAPENDAPDAAMRGFDTGATRSNDAGRYDPEGFLSPLVLERFCEYMHKHRVQADGKARDSDNWQRGMPAATWAKGLWRHFLHFWQRHRGWTVTDSKAAVDIEEDLCAMLFNIQGYLHQLVEARRQQEKKP